MKSFKFMNFNLVCPFLFFLVKISYLSTACMNIMSISIIDVNIIVLTHHTIDTLETRGEYYLMEIIFFYSDCLIIPTLWPIPYSKLVFKMSQDFLDIQYLVIILQALIYPFYTDIRISNNYKWFTYYKLTSRSQVRQTINVLPESSTLYRCRVPGILSRVAIK